MARRSTVKDPGVDQQATEQPDDPLTEYIDPNSPDAPHIAPEVLSDDLKPVDLTQMITGLWPGNPPHRSGNFYFDLNRLELAAGQTGLLGNLCENFVFERVDVHMIRPTEQGFSLALQLNDGLTLGCFDIEPGSLKTQRTEQYQLGRVRAGTFLGKQRVYLKLHDECPNQGRMVINFVGYLIEPWR